MNQKTTNRTTKDDLVCQIYEAIWRSGIDLETTLVAAVEVFRDVAISAWVASHLADDRPDQALQQQCEADILDLVKTVLKRPSSSTVFAEARRNIQRAVRHNPGGLPS